MIPQHIIDSAPDEPDEIARMRKFKGPRVDGSNLSADNKRNAMLENGHKISTALEKSGFQKITIQIGPTTYTVWNTRQNLEGLNKRLKSKPTRP